MKESNFTVKPAPLSYGGVSFYVTFITHKFLHFIFLKPQYMKYMFTFILCMMLLLSITASAQVDTTAAKKDTTSAHQPAMDSLSLAQTASVAAPNCYKQWYDFFSARGAKTVTDGTQEVVITFKSGESCHCFMGKVEVLGGKIKPPLHVQSENGEYKTFASLGEKLDADFVAAEGDQLYKIADGMSVLFKTADNEYGRLFFYKFINKGSQTNKRAPSPDELIKE